MSGPRSPTAQPHRPAAYQPDPQLPHPNQWAQEVNRGHARGPARPATQRTVSHYQVIRQLGRGGMGEVYLAEDTKLGRRVAIKFLTEESAADQGARRRLVREARAAAALDHPNICAIHEVCEEAGRAFIVMEYVEGETLAARIRRGPLALGECLGVAAQVADALAEAHSRGIIHRDVSPQNIMLTARRRAKVLDFGLAEVIRDRSLVDDEAVTKSLLTGQGAIAGTVAYMSPEQVRGEGLDARSDIFSLGAVLYEMVTGRQPFAAGSAADTISSILTREPAPLTRYARGVPAELERIVTKSLHKDREERYQTAKDLLTDLKGLKHRLELEEELGRSLPTVTGATHAGGALGRRRRGLLIAAAALASAVAALIYLFYFPTTGKAIDSVAVLPLVNVGGDPETEYLSDGITESLINSLSRVRGLRVVARATAFRYKGKEIDPRRVGRELGVGAVLTGRLAQRGDTLDIQVDLVETGEGTQVWGEQYEWRASDLLAVRQELARGVTENLRLRLGAEDEGRLTRGDAGNTEAYRLYLKGRYFWNKRTPADLKKSVVYFRGAIEKDPFFALAYAGLADSYGLLTDYEALPPEETYPLVKAAATRALEIDGELAEARTSLAYIKAFYEWDWAGAEMEFRRAIELNPNYATAHQWYAEYLSAMGRTEEALAEIRRAEELDPLSLIINAVEAWVLYFARDYDRAIAECLKVIEMDPNFAEVYEYLKRSYDRKGMYREAIAARQARRRILGRDAAETAALRAAASATNSKVYWRKRLEQEIEESKREGIPEFEMAEILAQMGETGRALDWLERAHGEHDFLLMYAKVAPNLDPLRSEPRFADLLRRLGLPH